MDNIITSDKKNIAQRCEELNNIVVNHIKSRSIQSIQAEIKDEAIANDYREEFVFPVEKSRTDNFAIAVFISLSVFLVFSITFSVFIIEFSREYRLYGSVGLVIFILIEIIHIIVLIRIFNKKRFNKRYRKYYAYLKNRKFALTDDISRLLELDVSIVLKDLKRAIDLRYIPQGKIVNEKLVVFSSETFANYSKNKNEIDAKVNILLQKNKSGDSKYAKEKQKIDSTNKLLREIKKQHKNNRMKTEFNNTERILMTLKYSDDFVEDEYETFSSMVTCFCEISEKIIGLFIELENKKNLYSKDTYEGSIEEYRETMEYINDAFENILSDYYMERSII